MAAHFYKVSEGGVSDGSLPRNMTSLRERLDTLKEKPDVSELIAAQRPGLKLRLPVRGATLPRY